MATGKVYGIRKWLRLRGEYSIGYYLTDFLFRKILQQNKGVRWPLHHTSTIHCPERLVAGKNVFPGDSPGVYINAVNGIEVGDYSNIGPHVGLISANHDFINNNQVTTAPPIIIGKYCWIGKGATILPGIQLGDFTIVGAGAIVTRSVPEGFCVIAGNPAKKIRDLDQNECKQFAANQQP